MKTRIRNSAPHVLAIALLASLITGFTGCATIGIVPRKTTLTGDRVELPTSVAPDRSFLFVDVLLNGQGPFHLLVDTGADTLFLSERVVEAAGLKRAAGVTTTVTGATGKKVKSDVVVVRRFEAGGFKADTMAAIVMTRDDEKNLTEQIPFDGACGLSVFADVVLEIDFPRRQIFVVRPETASYPADTGVALVQGKAAIELGGKSVPVKIDTGFDGTFGLPLENAALRYPQMTRRGALGVSIGEVRPVETSQLSGEIRLGPITWVNPPVAAGLGAIGCRALDTWKLAVDQRGQKIFFLGDEPRRQWPNQALRATAAGYVGEFEGSAIRVRRVITGSPAEAAGLRAGDILLTINDRAAVEFVTATGSDAGPQRRLRVRRDDHEFETIMTVPARVAPN